MSEMWYELHGYPPATTSLDRGYRFTHLIDLQLYGDALVCCLEDLFHQVRQRLMGFILSSNGSEAGCSGLSGETGARCGEETKGLPCGVWLSGVAAWATEWALSQVGIPFASGRDQAGALPLRMMNGKRDVVLLALEYQMKCYAGYVVVDPPIADQA